MFWFVAGALVVGSLLYLVLKGPARAWWHWALIIAFEAWCVFGFAVAAVTFAENNAKGGAILTAIVAAISLVAFVGLRAILRLRGGSGRLAVKTSGGRA